MYQVFSIACILLLPTLGFADERAADPADLPVQERTVGDNPRQQYFLLGSGPDRGVPPDGFRLLIVLPSMPGDGSLEATRGIFRRSIPAGFLLAQLVPVPNRKLRDPWPTAKRPDPGQDFTTEAFIAAVIADVAKVHPINKSRIYILADRLSVTAAASAMLTADIPIAGLLSVDGLFLWNLLPSIESARGKRFALLNTNTVPGGPLPPDDIAAGRVAQRLQAAGAAAVVLNAPPIGDRAESAYQGLRSAMEWLSR